MPFNLPKTLKSLRINNFAISSKIYLKFFSIFILSQKFQLSEDFFQIRILLTDSFLFLACDLKHIR